MSDSSPEQHVILLRPSGLEGTLQLLVIVSHDVQRLVLDQVRLYKNPLSFCLTTFGVIGFFSSLSFYSTLTNCNICNICSIHVCVHCVHVVWNLQT